MNLSVHEFIGLLRRAKRIYQRQGLIPLLSKGFNFFLGYSYQTYYLLEYRTYKRNEADFMPKAKNLIFRIVSKKEQLDELAASDFEFGSFEGIIRDWLKKGAIVFCIFINQELASIGYVAMSKETMKSLYELPYRVDFLNNEVCSGGAFTDPKYRGMGLLTYNMFKRLEFLRERGIIVARSSVAADNIAAQRVNGKFNPRIYAEGHRLRVSRFKFWWQRPPPKTSFS